MHMIISALAYHQFAHVQQLLPPAPAFSHIGRDENLNKKDEKDEEVRST